MTTDIPKRMNFYWGAPKMSYLRYLTLYSFCKFNPDWEVVLYVPSDYSYRVTWQSGEQDKEYEGEDYYPKCDKLPLNIKVFDMETIGRSNDLPEVYKSDIIRNYLLYKEGGFWSDMDILYTKPMDIPLDKDVVCQAGNCSYYSIGLIGGKKDSKLYSSLYLMTAAIPNGNEYQDFGRNLWNKLDTSDCYNLPMYKVYSIPSNKLIKIYSPGKLDKRAIGLHWYAGHPMARDWENLITPNNFIYDNILSDAIQKVLE